MVKRGPFGRAAEIESSIMIMLSRPENLPKGLTFGELRAALASGKEAEIVGSPNTLSTALKTLIRKGLIEKHIDTRRYRVPVGMPTVLTDELGRRSLATRINKSEEFTVLRDSTYEKGVMHGFVDKFSKGRGSDALVWEAHRMFDNMLGHLTRGILDLARANNLFDNAYFEKGRDPREIANDQLDKIWTDLNLRHRKMIITYEVDSENLLTFLKSNAGKSFLARAFNDFLNRPKRFHKDLDGIFYHDALTPRGRIRMSLPFKSSAVESIENKDRP
jgi:DNA-binding HxlR family transcriptional regulator